MIDRRAFVVGSLVAFAAPLAAEAQRAGKMPLIGVTVSGFAPNPYTDALRRGLADLGWVEGRNIRIEYRYIEGRRERIPALVTELIGLKPDVIVAGGGAIRFAKQVTSTMPIIFPAVDDPVAAGLVSSLARPGGNITGQAG